MSGYIRKYRVRFFVRGRQDIFAFEETSLDEVLQGIRDTLSLVKDHDFYSHMTLEWVRDIGVSDVDAPQQVSDLAEQGPVDECKTLCGARVCYIEGCYLLARKGFRVEG